MSLFYAFLASVVLGSGLKVTADKVVSLENRACFSTIYSSQESALQQSSFHCQDLGKRLRQVKLTNKKRIVEMIPTTIGLLIFQSEGSPMTTSLFVSLLEKKSSKAKLLKEIASCDLDDVLMKGNQVKVSCYDVDGNKKEVVVDMGKAVTSEKSDTVSIELDTQTYRKVRIRFKGESKERAVDVSKLVIL